MKNYFNQYEASNHLILMCCMIATNNFLEGNAITPQEKKLLKKASDLINDFSASVFSRLGEGYRKSLINKATLNTVRVVAKNVSHQLNKDMEDTIDHETLKEIIADTKDLNCLNCTRTDCQQCGIYKIKSYLHFTGINDDTDLCPFRQENKEVLEFDFGDF